MLTSSLRIVVAAAFVMVILTLAKTASAGVLEAPIGGKPIPLGDFVACGVAPGGWSVEPGARAVRPPASVASPGTAVDLKVAKTPSDCAATTMTLTLVALGDFPTLDPSSFVLSLDDGRLEGRGRGLRGTLVAFPTAEGLGVDVCRDPKSDGPNDVCTWAVPKSISADRNATGLRWLPAGAVATPGAIIFGANGKPIPPSALALSPARVELRQLLPSNPSVDVSSGVGLLRLTHPEAVVGVDCAPLKCDVTDGNLAVAAPSASVTAIDVKFRLIPHVAYAGKASPEPVPSIHVALLRCPMSIASGAVPRGVDRTRAVVKVEGVCARDVAALHFVLGGRKLDVVEIQRVGDVAYVALLLGSVDGEEVSMTAVRADSGAQKATVEGAVVAIARARTYRLPIVRSVLELPGHPSIDFVPNNRTAIVHVPKVPSAELVLLPLDGVYTTKVERAVTLVQGDVNAAGEVTFQFGYRVPSLPAPFDKLDLAVLNDSLQRAVKEANVPAPFDTSAESGNPLVEVTCFDGDGGSLRVHPGVAVHVPYAQRDGCRLILHREKLDPAFGTQKLQLEIDIVKLDGSTRPEGHVSQTIVLRAGSEPRIAWIHGVSSPYDRANIRLTHVADEAHYLGALEIATGAPMVQWSVIFGTGRVRLYATTAIPTGLYRFGDSHSSGPLSLNFGVISRFTWLDSEGHEGLIGLEAGVLAFGLTGDTTASGNTLTQVGGVVGAGLAIPIANAGQATQASINLHAWFEQRLTPGGGDRLNSPRAIIFGPSISVGNVGTTF